MTATMYAQRSRPVAEGNVREQAGYARSARVWAVGGALVVTLIVGSLVVFPWSNRQDRAAAPAGLVIPPPYDADRAYDYLLQICDLGPRPSATPAMRRQQ